MKLDHVSVLLEEAVENLRIKPGAVVVDATFGRGGHSRKILEIIGPDGILIGIDQDYRVVEMAKKEKWPANLILENARFSQLTRILKKHDVSEIDGILFDLGMSSVQLDDEIRGFNWKNESAPLDMRMSGMGLTASEVLNTYSESELESVFQQFGDIYHNTFIRKLVSSRRAKKFSTVGDLMNVVRMIWPSNQRNVYARVWQALRIEVNQEMFELEEGLGQAVAMLKGGGRIAVISFHSGEDRKVKDFFYQNSRECLCPPDLPTCVCNTEPRLKIINKKAIKPTTVEIARNIRSKSARLRVAEKI